MKKIKYIIAVLLTGALLLACVGCQTNSSNVSSDTTVSSKKATNWQGFLDKYRYDDKVEQVIFVQRTQGSNADLLMFTKDKEHNNAWTQVLKTDAFVGKDGIGTANEEVAFTPIGDFGFSTAFGVKPNPGTKLPYIDVTDELYCCNEPEYYNQIINAKEVNHNCTGEHLIEYTPAYNYGLFIDYNKENVYPNGSAIFFHCNSLKEYTGGCVAIAEEEMIKVLQTVTDGCRIIIDEK